MTPQPELAADAAVAGAGEPAASVAAGTGPFVLNLCSSSTPMALAQTELPELRRFTFFVSRRFEEGRERFRLHMGYFATLAEAEEWLGVVREIYPGAWAGDAPGRKLRERAAAAAAAQAQRAVGPQQRLAAVPAAAPVAFPVRAPEPPPPMHIPVVHAAPVAARAAPTMIPAIARQKVAPPAPRAAPAPVVNGPVKVPAAASAARPAPAAARPAPAAARPAPAAARPAPAAARPAPATARPLARTQSPTGGKSVQPPAARAGARPASAPAPRPAPAQTAAAQPAGARSAPQPPRAPAARAAGAKPVFQDSNLREVLAALGDTSATGETRLMHAPPAPRNAPAADGQLSDTQVLRVLENRQPDDGSKAADVQDAPASSIPMLKPDDTGTRAALKEAVASNAPVSFAVQLQWSVQPVELDKVPPLAIFSAYTLYTVEGSREGRRWYGLRLGFFTDAISAKQVAYYVRSEFGSVAVVPVSPQERARATDDDRRAAALAVPAGPRRATEDDEFKLIDTDEGRQLPAVPQPAPAKPAARPVAAGPRGRGRAKVGARERKGPQTLEETLEILGASQLAIDDGSGETLNDTGVRHLRVEVQKNSPFSRLLERLSERVKKP